MYKRQIEVGWPTAIRTDGGPQFRSEFPQFCDKHGIKHELSSPYNPESNGLAEAAVKNIKAIITRCHKERENIKLAIAAWRNMARTDGVSPSQLFYGRRQRQLLPLTGEQAKTQASSTAGRDKTAGNSELARNKHTSNYTELQDEEKVWMQHHITGKWDTAVRVVRKRRDGNSYVVIAPDGNTYIRGRRLLKPISSPDTSIKDRDQPPTSIEQHKEKKRTTTGQIDNMPRRSPRNHISTRAADIEIAAQITAIYIRDLEDGSETFRERTIHFYKTYTTFDLGGELL